MTAPPRPWYRGSQCVGSELHGSRISDMDTGCDCPQKVLLVTPGLFEVMDALVEALLSCIDGETAPSASLDKVEAALRLAGALK